MANTPLISVIMPVYNGEKYLREAIDSILNQTFTDFEFIILNDGSTDKTEEIILSYDDPRIVYVKNETNLQIVKTLNKGIEIAKGKYIARMDADDISLPERFEKQIVFMTANPAIDVCGVRMGIINQNKHIWSYPEKHEEIKAQLLFNTPMSHPTLLIKKTFFEDFKYEISSDKAEDYHLWSESIDSKKFVNIPEILFLYRLHFNQTCKTSRNIQLSVANSVRVTMLKRIEIFPTVEEVRIHTNFSLLRWNSKDRDALIKWLNKILIKNQQLKYFDENALKKSIGNFWWRMFNAHDIFSLKIFWYFIVAPYHLYDKRPMKDYIKLFTKCLIRWNRNAK